MSETHSYLKIEPVKMPDTLKNGIASENDLIALLDQIYGSLAVDEAVEIHVYQEFILIGKRQRGHGDVFTFKFTNYGFSPNHRDNKSESLAFAIRAIDNGSLPEYCYQAINGDVEALRLTTKHLIRAYEAKIRRMQEKGKEPKSIEAYRIRCIAAKGRLELPEADFLSSSEPIIIEIPKDPKYFFMEDEVHISGENDENGTTESD